MLAASETLTAVITGAARGLLAASVEVDFDRDGYAGIDDLSNYLETVSVARSLQTDVPDGTRLVVGYAEADGTVALHGNRYNNDENAAWTFSPANAASPYYGKRRVEAPVRIRVGFVTSAGTELLDRFVGHVRSLVTDGSDRSASLAVLDGSDALHTQVQLPMVTTDSVPDLDGVYFIKYILDQNGVTGYNLEPSLNPLTTTPNIDPGQDAWGLIQQIAAAEYGVAFFDETGRFNFWNRQHFTRQSVDYTAMTVTANGVTNPIPQVASDRELKTLTMNEAVDSVRNHITVAYSSYEIQPVDWIWQSSNPIRIPIRGTRTVTATFDSPCINVSNQFAFLGHNFTSGGKSGYRACRRLNGLGEAVTNLQITVSVTAQSAKITIHNPNPYWCYLVCPQADSRGNLFDSSQWGQPMLWLKGQAVVDKSTSTSTTDGSTGQQAEARDEASITDFGEQVYAVDAGGWVQDDDTAQTLADDLLRLLARPMPYLDDVDVVADPRLQIGDRIQLVDKTGTALDEHCWIVGVNETPDPGSGYAQTLTLRMCGGIGSMIWDHQTRGVWDAGYAWDGVY